MIKLFERRTRIVVDRVKKKKNPFIYKSYSPKPKHKWVHKRNIQERRFKRAGFIAILIAFLFLASLMWNISSNGYSAFTEAKISLPVTFNAKLVVSQYDRLFYDDSNLHYYGFSFRCCNSRLPRGVCA